MHNESAKNTKIVYIVYIYCSVWNKSENSLVPSVRVEIEAVPFRKNKDRSLSKVDWFIFCLRVNLKKNFFTLYCTMSSKWSHICCRIVIACVIKCNIV